MLDIMDTVDQWISQGQAVALATVTDTWGSSPRPVGAKMAVRGDLAMIGSVSGGCVESAVLDAAVDSLKDAKPRLLHFGVSDDTAWDVGLACGGKISVYVEPLDRAWWQAVSERAHQDRTTATITVIDGPTAGQKLMIDAAGIAYVDDKLQPEQREALIACAQMAIQHGQTEHSRVADLEVLIDVHRPRPRLIIVGGAHVAMALDRFAQQLGFGVALVDPRTAFATKERFPDTDTILHSYPDKAFAQLSLDENTFIAILTHDPKIDDPALRVALAKHVPYVGVLSSKRAHEQRVKRLTAAGISAEQLAHIHTPIGLNINARTPEEIALCIMAEIVAVRNGARS